MKYYLHCLKNYTNFSGRARRSEYWFFILFHFIFMIAIIFLGNFFDGFFSLVEDDSNFMESLPLILFGIYCAAVLIPTLAVTARRLHDMGKSGTWVFIYFVPLIGGIWLLVLLFSDSEFGRNKWGYNPKDEAIDEIDEIGNYLIP